MKSISSSMKTIMRSKPLSDSLLLQHLERIAAALDIEVRYESLADEDLSIQSGGCRILSRHLILIDSNQPLSERARLLAQEISRWDLENLFILPQVRDFIARQLEGREKNRPQR